MPPLSLENVVSYVVQVSLITAATGAGLTLARVRSPRVRYAAWTALLWIAGLLPLLQPWDVTTTIVVATQALTSAGVPGAVAAAIDVPPLRSGAAAAWNPVVVLLLAGTTCRLLWLLAGVIRLRGIARRAGSDLTDGIALQAAIQTQADIRYSGDLAQPATCGFRRPIILLPLTLRSLNPSVRRAVLAHELVHVKRRDWTALMVEELLRAALWFNPAVWWLVDRVHLSREEVVDAEALKFVDGRRSYVRALLAFADAPAIVAAPAFARRRHLFSRIQRLCEESRMSPYRLLVASCLVAAAAGSSGVYAVSAFPILSGDDVLVAPAAPPADARPDGPRPVNAAIPQDPPPPPPARTAVYVRDKRLPRLIRDVKPYYTAEAMRAGIEGTVVLEATIGADGLVSDAVVIRGIPMLDESALAAVRQWVFEPPVEAPVVAPIEMRFTLRKGDSTLQPPPPPTRDRGQTQRPPSAVSVRATPAVLREVTPVYPPEAMSAGIEGSVEVEMMIGAEGKVTHVRVLRSDNPVFDEPALTAARQWLFAKPTEGSVVRTVELFFTLASHSSAGRPLSHPNLFEIEPDAVRVGSNIRTPVKLRDVRPEYPPIARSAGVRGMVIVEVLIGRDGRVADARILRSIPLLDQAAVDAVRQWEFRPTLMNGTPVPVIMTVTVNFTER